MQRHAPTAVSALHVRTALEVSSKPRRLWLRPRTLAAVEWRVRTALRLSAPVKDTVYGNSFEPGWAVLSLGSGRVRQQQVVGAVSNGSKAFGAALPSSGISHLNCNLEGLGNELECCTCILGHAAIASQAQCWPTVCHLQVELYFNCQNCSQIGYGLFKLNKTSGFQADSQTHQV